MHRVRPASFVLKVLTRIENFPKVGAGREAAFDKMAAADGFQATAEERVTVHHYANVLFNVLRGSIFDDQYNISLRDVRRTLRHFNAPVYERNKEWLDTLPDQLRFDALQTAVEQRGDR